MATASSSGLVRNTDFSAELLLNKIMNEEYRANSGKTLTIGGRMNASNLDATSYKYAAEAEDVAKMSVFADATQDVLTEVLALAKQIQSNASLTDKSAIIALGKEISTQFTSITGAVIDGLSVLNTTLTANLGFGSGSISLGMDSSTFNAHVAGLTAALTAMATGSAISSVLSNLETSINMLIADVAVHGAKASLMAHRYQSLNDLATVYKNASDDQAVNVGGSASSLLNALL